MKCNECKDINECEVDLSEVGCERIVIGKCTKCKYTKIPSFEEPCRNCKGDVNYFEPMNNGNVQANILPVGKLEDIINNPKHYTQGAIECIDVIEEITKPCSKFEAYIIGTVLKYLWRFKFKNGLEDLQKARFYLNRLIEKMEKEDSVNE